MIRFQCTSCGKGIQVADAAAGKKGKCPACGILLTVPAATASLASVISSSPGHTSAASASRLVEETIAFRCPTCNAGLKVPGKLAGRKGKCPKCGEPLAIPTSSPKKQSRPVGMSPLDALAAVEASAVATPPPSVSAPQNQGTATSTIGGVRCPSCLALLPAEAKICAHCGIYLHSGRPLLTSRDTDMDLLYIWVERVLRPLSWIFAVGIYPVYSEARGKGKPYTIWAIAILTILVSCWFWAHEWTGSSAIRSHKNLMLWTGKKEPSTEIIAAYYIATNWGDTQAFLEKYQEFESRMPEEDAIRQAHNALPPEKKAIGEYRGYQLITHAFLHGGIVHLAGNLLFLLVFGSRVNAIIGNIAAVILYPLLAIMAGLLHLQMGAHGEPSPMLGASGAIMGLAGVYLVLFPFQKIHMVAWWRWGLIGGFRLGWKLFAVRGIFVVLAYMAFDFIFVALKIQDNTARWAHIGGFLAGCGLGVLLLVCRLAYSGGDLLSLIFGKYAWPLLGRPASRIKPVPSIASAPQGPGHPLQQER